MRWFEHPQIADMVLSARAGAQHAGFVALQPIVDLLELIVGRIKKRGARNSRSSFPPGA